MIFKAGIVLLTLIASVFGADHGAYDLFARSSAWPVTPESELRGQDNNVITPRSASDDVLAQESKQAILAAGISEGYFAKHFHLLRVQDKVGDRRVLWRLSVNDYEAEISDAIGYYTVGGRRINTHSISSLLSPAREIVQTIPRARAEKLMRACIGSFRSGTVNYRIVSGQTELVLNAEAVARKGKPKREKEKERETAERERADRGNRPGQKRPPGDVIENEGAGDGPPIVLGTINLETGKCLKGRAIATP